VPGFSMRRPRAFANAPVVKRIHDKTCMTGFFCGFRLCEVSGIPAKRSLSLMRCSRTFGAARLQSTVAWDRFNAASLSRRRHGQHLACTCVLCAREAFGGPLHGHCQDGGFDECQGSRLSGKREDKAEAERGE